MYLKDLENFKEYYLIDEEAIPLLQELHCQYGELFLYEHLKDCEVRHTLTVMYEIKKELEEKFLFSICSTNETMEDVLKIDLLFPNINLIWDFDEILQAMIQKCWIDEFAIMRKKENGSHFRIREKTIFAKGLRWNECSDKIKNHFLSIKDENVKK